MKKRFSRVFPNVLLIGGVKCGSTTLYDDLVTHPEVYGSAIKEPGFLALEKDANQIWNHYRTLYKKGMNHRWRIDGSTRYGIREQSPHIANNAYDLLGAETRIIYVIREPIGRIISHYRHGFDAGRIRVSLDRAVTEHPMLLAASRYAHQLEPWVKHFGEDALFVTEFSYYCANRKVALSQVQRFLGLEPRSDLVNPESISNSAESRRTPPAVVTKLQESAIYKTQVAPYLPKRVISLMKSMLTKGHKKREISISIDTVENVLRILGNDLRRTSELVRCPVQSKETIWDFDQLSEKYTGGNVARNSGI